MGEFLTKTSAVLLVALLVAAALALAVVVPACLVFLLWNVVLVPIAGVAMLSFKQAIVVGIVLSLLGGIKIQIG